MVAYNFEEVVVKFLLSPGGSERGWSFYSSVLPCPKYHSLKYAEAREPSWGKGCSETGKLQPYMVGSLTHAYLEAFYTSGNTSKLIFQDSLTSELLQGFDHEEVEAWRLFQSYQKEYQAGELSEPVCENECRDESGDLGVPLFTSRVDMVAFHTGGPLKNLDLELPAGNYLWEHKTASSRSQFLFEEHRVQVQSNIYLWNKCNPGNPVAGGILNNIVKTQKVGFQRIFIPCPSDRDIENLRMSLAFIQTVLEKYPTQMVASKSSCTSGWTPCEFYSTCWSGR